MGSDLSCFDWLNHSSGHLDGNLPPALQKSADQHLDHCKDCRERHQRYRVILDRLGGLKRVPAPPKVKYEREPQEKGRNHPGRPGWSRMDRVTRPVLRTLRGLNARSWAWITISFLGFVILTSLPRLRAFYEARLQKKLDAVNFAELPLTQAPQAGEGAESDDAVIDDFGGDEGDEGGEGGEEDSTHSRGGGLVKASWEGEWDPGRSKTESSHKNAPGAQLWRFTLRTDSPQDLRQKIQQLLLDSGAAPTSRMIHGFVAPGGIQFDVLVPVESIPTIQEALQKLSNEHSPPSDAEGGENPYPTEPFTWYRNRSKRPLPPGAARVVIWLSLT